MAATAYSIHLPARRDTAVIFASPHSGRAYGAEFLGRSVLDARTIRSSEDAFVDDLLAAVPGFGAPLLAAIAPRAYVDLNRGADELDPAVIEGARIASHNPRISSGLGVIPRVVSGGRAIYRGKLPMAEAQARLRDWWHPYHACLQQLLGDSHRQFGQAILMDVHSMPHEAMEAIAARPGYRPDVVVGDRYGASASADLVMRIEEAFRTEGFRVARNAPFAGAYVTQAYGRPGMRQHAVQIELDRALYMDERRIEPRADFPAFRDRLTRVLSVIADLGRPESEAGLAAE
ncbi:MAG: N-formylglutamate amidohydrolase [Rhodobacteraceae bacterium]|nr:N-formylglutamate amidohydrolase [Paracoccaceae bacterium]